MPPKRPPPQITVDVAIDSDKVEINPVIGVYLTLLYAPGESKDEIMVWWPEKKALLPADNFYKAFPSIYAIRGTPSR